MTSHNPLHLRVTDILREIADLGPMRKGSLCKRLLKRRTASGQIKTRGPYWYYTFKKNNRSVCKMLGEQAAPVVQEQIERFRRFQSLSRQYVEASHQMADVEAEKAGRKKTLAPDRGGKETRSRGHRRSSAR